MDSSPPDAAPLAPITVTIYDNSGAPVAGLPVAFLDQNDAVVLETTTDNGGVATVTMPAGGSATVGASALSGGNVYTWLDLKPGDQLLVGSPARITTGSTITPEVSTSLVNGTGAYVILGQCPPAPDVQAHGGTPGPYAMAFDASCTTANFFGESVDPTHRLQLAASYQTNVPVADGATITLDDLTLASNVATTATNVPSQYTSFNTNFTLYDGVETFGNIHPIFNVVNGAVNAQVAFAQVGGLDLVTSTSFEGTLDNNAIGQEIYITERFATGLTAIATDVSALTIPQTASLPVFDFNASSLTWTESPAGTADTSWAEVQVTSASGDATQRDYTWDIIGPHNADAALHVPALPTSLVNFNVLSTDTVSPNYVQVSQSPTGYDSTAATLLSYTGATTLQVGQQFVETDCYAN